MTPRKDVDWVDISLDARGVRDKLLETPHSRLPVARGSVDDIVGVVQARDIAAALFQGETLALEQLMRPAKAIHDQIAATDALAATRQSAGYGKSVSVRLASGGTRCINKNQHKTPLHRPILN